MVVCVLVMFLEGEHWYWNINQLDMIFFSRKSSYYIKAILVLFKNNFFSQLTLSCCYLCWVVHINFCFSLYMISRLIHISSCISLVELFTSAPAFDSISLILFPVIVLEHIQLLMVLFTFD